MDVSVVPIHLPCRRHDGKQSVRCALTLSFQRHNTFILVLGGQQIDCADIEFSYIDPPSGQTCSQYLGPYISANGGYVQNSGATSQCQFCRYRTTDEYLLNNFNIEYSHRWRDLGIFIVFIAFNVGGLSVSRRYIEN